MNSWPSNVPLKLTVASSEWRAAALRAFHRTRPQLSVDALARRTALKHLTFEDRDATSE